MKYLVFLLTLMFAIKGPLKAQSAANPWTEKQLMAPGALAERITKGQGNNVMILAVGPDAVIKGSVNAGPAHEAAHLDQLKNLLKTTPKNKEIIIYCGCCPFDRCPNIRPAFKTITDMGFKNVRLLNLEKNIKTNWLDKNYPTND
ncbi:MAG: rhodanese-like domain-containing protein [Niabella sp.]|nr:rhodanese-like domain-containing protein [Niabella sp.]